jgi:hypothetical protein
VTAVGPGRTAAGWPWRSRGRRKAAETERGPCRAGDRTGQDGTQLLVGGGSAGSAGAGRGRDLASTAPSPTEAPPSPLPVTAPAANKAPG